MPGHAPGIHVFFLRIKDVDGRLLMAMPGDDEESATWKKHSAPSMTST